MTTKPAVAAPASLPLTTAWQTLGVAVPANTEASDTITCSNGTAADGYASLQLVNGGVTLGVLSNLKIPANGGLDLRVGAKLPAGWSWQLLASAANVLTASMTRVQRATP